MKTLKNYMVFSGAAIRHARKAKGLKIGELAERIGLSIGQMSYIETDKRSPRASDLKRIQEVLGVPPIVIM